MNVFGLYLVWNSRTISMFYNSFIVIFVVMGVRGQPIDEQPLSVGINNMTVAVNPHRNPLQIVVVNGANCVSTTRSSTIRRRDDYQHTPGIGYHKLHTRALDWNSARKSCQDEGGHLAIINSLAEAEVLRDILNRSGPIVGARSDVEAYIGIHDQFKEGEWITVFGESLASAGYTKWTDRWARIPDNAGGKQNCGALVRDGGLDDVYCSDSFGYFCELPIVQMYH